MRNITKLINCDERTVNEMMICNGKIVKTCLTVHSGNHSRIFRTIHRRTGMTMGIAAHRCTGPEIFFCCIYPQIHKPIWFFTNRIKQKECIRLFTWEHIGEMHVSIVFCDNRDSFVFMSTADEQMNRGIVLFMGNYTDQILLGGSQRIFNTTATQGK